MIALLLTLILVDCTKNDALYDGLKNCHSVRTTRNYKDSVQFKCDLEVGSVGVDFETSCLEPWSQSLQHFILKQGDTVCQMRWPMLRVHDWETAYLQLQGQEILDLGEAIKKADCQKKISDIKGISGLADWIAEQVAQLDVLVVPYYERMMEIGKMVSSRQEECRKGDKVARKAIESEQRQEVMKANKKIMKTKKEVMKDEKKISEKEQKFGEQDSLKDEQEETKEKRNENELEEGRKREVNGAKTDNKSKKTCEDKRRENTASENTEFKRFLNDFEFKSFNANNSVQIGTGVLRGIK